MNQLSLFHFAVFLVNLWLIFFILSKNPKGLPNWICALLISCFAIWNFAFTFFHTSLSPGSAIFWLNISSIGWCSISAFALWLSLALTKREKILKKWYFYFLIFLIPAFLIYKQWTGYLVNGVVKQSYGWGIVWSTSVWPWIFYTSYIPIPIIVLYLGYTYIKERKLLIEKKRIKLTISSGFIFFIMASLTEVVFPRLNIYVVPSIGAIMTIFLAIAIIYGITKYRLMTLTPAYAASDILASMSDSLFLIGPDGKIIEANNAAFALLGYTKEEITGSPAAAIFPESVAIFFDDRGYPLLKEELFEKHQIFLRTKKREDIPVSFSASSMKDKEGNLLGIVGVATDLRGILLLQKREKELAVEKARSEAFQERSQELQEAYDKLRTTQAQLIQSEKMAAVGLLAGGVAHEINNPMGVILGFAQSILKRIKEDDPLYKPLKSIEREAVRCRDLIVDLLTFSRTKEIGTEKLEINGTIDEILLIIEAGAKIKNIKIMKEYQDNLPSIKGNRNQIQQVIMNLCNNAIDAMPDGGIIKVATKLNENRIELSITDNGMGMTEETMKHIYEPFFTTKEVGKGTGMGLSLCYETIKKHNGTIEVVSKLNKGTVFTIKLPLKEV